jgi:demethylmenaquinone methyltransferase / 2-methoxy-6-polyprenyl-1,4-benzoquinol methylase
MTRSREAFAEHFFSGNAASYDQIARFSTLGLDAWWKRKILEKIPADARRVLEQACGTGILTVEIARRLPRCRIVGVEPQADYLDIAREKVRALRLRNIEFIQGRAEEVTPHGEFDCIVSDYLAKYVDLDILVARARGMLRPGGVLIMHELTRPSNPLFLSPWKLHFKFLQTYGSWKHPEWETAFRDLPALLARSRWVDELRRALTANKFREIKADHLFFGASAMVSARNGG